MAVGRIRHAVEQHPVVAFLAVTFGYSWSIEFFVYSLLGPSPTQFVVVVAAWGPLVGAVAVTVILGDSVRELLGQVRKWRMSPRWYLLALLLPVVVGETDALVYVAAGVPIEFADSLLSRVVVPFVITLFAAGALEEFGWRGFAQPRLQSNYAAGLVATGIGLAWAAWHLPFFVLFDFGAFDLGGLHWYVLEVVGFSIVLAWLYNQTNGSLLIVMLSHAAHNAGNITAPATETAGLTARAADLIPDITAVLVAVGLLIVFGHDRLSRSALSASVIGKPGSSECTSEATTAD